VALELPFALEPTDVLYLFDAGDVRVDQLGLAGTPAGPGDCVGRLPDAFGPADGYDWRSSGAGSTLFKMPCSMGAPNEQPTATEGSGRAPGTWGALKGRFR
jgi:hypothetical protein